MMPHWCPRTKFSPAIIKINTLQAMYGKDTFKPQALLHCFSSKTKHEDILLVQIKEIAALLGRATTSTMIVLAFV